MDCEVKSSYNEAEIRWDVDVSGEIDIFNSETFKETLIALISQNETGIHINCAELSYIDSTGLGALVSVLKKVRLYGGDIVLSNLKHTISKLFKITNLDKAFVMEGDVIE